MAFLLHNSTSVPNERAQAHRMVTPAIHRAVEFHASARPDAVAIADGARAITYRELNARANVVARWLMDHRLRRTNVVLISLPRSIELAIVMLGTLKAGGAYCWIDPARGASAPHALAVLPSV